MPLTICSTVNVDHYNVVVVPVPSVKVKMLKEMTMMIKTTTRMMKMLGNTRVPNEMRGFKCKAKEFSKMITRRR